MVDKPKGKGEKKEEEQELDLTVFGVDTLVTEKDYIKFAEDTSGKIKSVTEKSKLISGFLKQTFDLIVPNIDPDSLNNIIDSMDIIVTQKKKDADKLKKKETIPLVNNTPVQQVTNTNTATANVNATANTNTTNGNSNSAIINNASEETKQSVVVEPSTKKKPRFDPDDFM